MALRVAHGTQLDDLDELTAVTDRVTPAMVRKTFFYETPDDIAKEIVPFVEKGSTVNLVADFAPMLTPVVPEEIIEASAEICRLIKQVRFPEPAAVDHSSQRR